LAATGVVIVGLVGVYLHPMLEVKLVAYIALIASTAWVFADSQKFDLNRWPWTLGTLVLWAFVFPSYLWKTRRWQGLIPGLALVVTVVLLQAFPNFYPAKKHFRRGLIFASQQRLTKAEEEFKFAIQKDPTLGEAHMNLGILYMGQGLLEAAEKEFILAKDLISQHDVSVIPQKKNEAVSLCLANLAALYALRTSESIQILDRMEAKRHYQKAKEYADQSIQLDGTNVRAEELVRRLKSLATFLE
jgi:tetratricopeptide (TPR) repeat protein